MGDCLGILDAVDTTFLQAFAGVSLIINQFHRSIDLVAVPSFPVVPLGGSTTSKRELQEEMACAGPLCSCEAKAKVKLLQVEHRPTQLE